MFKVEAVYNRFIKRFKSKFEGPYIKYVGGGTGGLLWGP